MLKTFCDTLSVAEVLSCGNLTRNSAEFERARRLLESERVAIRAVDEVSVEISEDTARLFTYMRASPRASPRGSATIVFARAFPEDSFRQP